MKKLLIIFSVVFAMLITTLIVVANLPTSITGVRGAADLPRIFYTESFDQAEDEYFVYFWNAACPACQRFDPDVRAAYERGVMIYVVDMADDRNASAWFQGERGMNNQRPQNASEIEVAGTPSLLRIVNGEVVGYATGIPDGIALFAMFGQ